MVSSAGFCLAYIYDLVLTCKKRKKSCNWKLFLSKFLIKLFVAETSFAETASPICPIPLARAQSPNAWFVPDGATMVICVLNLFHSFTITSECYGKPSPFSHTEQFFTFDIKLTFFCQHGWWKKLCNLWMCNYLVQRTSFPLTLLLSEAQCLRNAKLQTEFALLNPRIASFFQRLSENWRYFCVTVQTTIKPWNTAYGIAENNKTTKISLQSTYHISKHFFRNKPHPYLS